MQRHVARRIFYFDLKGGSHMFPLSEALGYGSGSVNLEPSEDYVINM